MVHGDPYLLALEHWLLAVVRALNEPDRELMKGIVSALAAAAGLAIVAPQNRSTSGDRKSGMPGSVR